VAETYRSWGVGATLTPRTGKSLLDDFGMGKTELYSKHHVIRVINYEPLHVQITYDSLQWGMPKHFTDLYHVL